METKSFDFNSYFLILFKVNCKKVFILFSFILVSVSVLLGFFCGLINYFIYSINININQYQILFFQIL